jgi:Cdc6-like AAA superfamily ATPase
MEILRANNDAEYFDCSSTTSKILDTLKERRPKLILLDETDKMSHPFQNQLLSLLESGMVKITQMKRSYDFKIEGLKVIATAKMWYGENSRTILLLVTNIVWYNYMTNLFLF